MPKALTAKNISSIQSLSFQEEDGRLTGAILTFEVNYGELGLGHQLDVWSLLLPPQRERLQAIYDSLKALAQREFIE